jgi:hypothetical protein
MSKELEKELINDVMNSDELQVEPNDIVKILYDIYNVPSGICKQIKDMVQRLESIDNVNPSGALKYVNGKIADLEDDLQHYTMVDKNKIKEFFIREDLKEFTNIQQVLLKMQKLEEMTIELCEYCGMDNLYPYDNLEEIEITFKDTFDNYQRQRIESLGRLNKQEKENAEYEEVLKLVFDKKVDIYHLSKSKTVEDYNSIWDSSTYCLTEEEFDLLKRWQNGKRI